MIGWAATVLLLAISAALLGFSGIAGLASQVARILFLTGSVLCVLSFLFSGRGQRYW
jgi:uncharacterized membrane protein YtjA (UPF0391 family)